MKRWVRLFLVVCLLAALLLSFGLDAGSAMAAVLQATDTPTATVTPTSTYHSLFSTPTSIPPEGYICPTSVPIGWGTVTPGLYWSANCGRCLISLTPTVTQTVAATFTPDLTQSPTPSLTPTITPTPNPNGLYRETTLAYSPVIQSGWWASTGSGNPFQYREEIGAVSLQRLSVGPIAGIEVQYIVSAPSVPPSSNFQLGPATGASDVWIGNGTEFYSDAVGDPVFISSPVIITQPYASSVWGLDGAPGAAVIFGSEAGYNSWVSQFGSDVDLLTNIMHEGDIYGEFRGSTTWFNFEPDYLVEYQVIVLAIWYYGPEVGSQPEEATYCAVVEGGGMGVSEFFDEILPPILVGESQCSTFGPINIQVPDWIAFVLGVDEFSFPEVGICFQPYEFGVVNLLGLSLDLGLYVFIIGSVSVLLWFLRS